MRYLSNIILNLLLFVLIADVAHAEFIQSGLNVYQDSQDLRAKVIVTKIGIFIVYTSNNDEGSLQRFNISNSKAEGTLSAFISYNSVLNVYDQLIVGDKVFPIRGSFSLNVGEITTKVDNIATPYITIIGGNSSKNPSIIPITGVTPFGIYSGPAVAVLEANSELSKIPGIAPYVVENNLTLSLKGAPFNDGAVGLALQQSGNSCLQNGTLYIEGFTLQKIKNLKDPEQQQKTMKEAIKKAKENNSPANYIFLKIIKEEAIAFNPVDSSIHLLKPVPSESEVKLCEISRVKL